MAARRKVMCRECRKTFSTSSTARRECTTCRPKADHKGMRENYGEITTNEAGEIVGVIIRKPVLERMVKVRTPQNTQ